MGELYHEAVRQDGYAFQYIPQRATAYNNDLPLDFIFNHFLLLNCQYGFKGAEVSSAINDMSRYLDFKQETGGIDSAARREKLDDLNRKLEKLKAYFKAPA